MELKEAVRMAIENEVKGREMYIDFAKKAKNNVTMKTFDFLANEELRHIEKIKEVANAIEKGASEIPDLNPSSIDDMKKIFGTSIKEFDKQVKPDSGDLDAHKMAMDFERKSFDFYEKVANETENEKVKMFFDALKKEENDHFEFIEKAYNFINDPEGFYAEEEGWSLDGG